MQLTKLISNGLIGLTAVVYVSAKVVPDTQQSGPVLTAAAAFVAPKAAASSAVTPSSAVGLSTAAALGVLSGAVKELSNPMALETAFRSYFAFKNAHPDQVAKPYLYYVDYGLPSTQPRGYVFDMSTSSIVDGPFTVAHGRGSSTSRYGIPTRFSNASGSEATSLGLYLTGGTYAFHGKSGGHSYSSVGLRLQGVSSDYNDNALARGVVAHGAPYVSADKAGRSEGCPAIEPSRAARLLPKLAEGAMVFLFAPDADWMARDPWVVAAAE